MFTLDLLPIHPHPRELESFTGYLTRLAEANAIRQMNRLNVLTGLFLAEVRSPSDFPVAAGFRQLPQLTGCSIERLNGTTIYHLLRKFGRTTAAPQRSKQFLDESVAYHLRYCPACLVEHGYISLLWRFLAIRSCPLSRSE